MRLTVIGCALALALFSSPVFAQGAPPGPGGANVGAQVRGSIVSFANNVVTVKQQDGANASVTVPADLRVTARATRTLADIKAGMFVGSAAVEGADGKLYAEEVHIFPEAMRGTGEGHRPMDRPERTMTNANVATVVGSPSGNAMTLQYPAGKTDIVVKPGTPVTEIVPASTADFKPGALISIGTIKNADGSLSARMVTVEKDGMKPF